MRNSILCLFTLFFALGATAASDSHLLTHKPVEYTFAFNPYPDAHGRKINEILQKIANSSGRLRAFTRYSFHAELKLSYRQLNDNSYLVEVFAADTYVTGDTQYRDFSLGEVLIPDNGRMRVRLTAPGGEVVFDELFDDIDISARTWLSFDLAFDGEISSLEVSFADLYFHYGEAMQQRMLHWTEALASYYASDDKLRRIDTLTGDLEVSTPAKLLLDEFVLCEAEALLGEIRYAPFHAWIDIEKDDPAGIFPSYLEASERLELLRHDFNDAIAQIDVLFYEAGLQYTADSLLSEGRQQFMSALSYNPLHIPSHLAIARLDMVAGDEVAALNRLGQVYAGMYPSGGNLEKSKLLSDSVLDLFYEKAWELILDKNFTASLNMLEHVDAFCRQASDRFNCPPLFQMLTRRSHRGIYDAYIVVSERALRNNNVELASIYIQSAMDYQQAHSQHIPNSQEAMVLMFRLLWRHRLR